jgi:hypothetical protein
MFHVINITCFHSILKYVNGYQGSVPGVEWPGCEVNHSPPRLAANTRLFSFNMTQSRVVVGLYWTYTLRRHLHLLWLTNSPLCRRCEVEDETSAHILCECAALAAPRHVYLGSILLDPKYITSLRLEAIWNFSKETGLRWTGIKLWGKKGPFLRLRCIGTIRAQTQLLIKQTINHLHPVPRIRMSGATPLLNLFAFVVCPGKTLPFTKICSLYLSGTRCHLYHAKQT